MAFILVADSLKVEFLSSLVSRRQYWTKRGLGFRECVAI